MSENLIYRAKQKSAAADLAIEIATAKANISIAKGDLSKVLIDYSGLVQKVHGPESTEALVAFQMAQTAHKEAQVALTDFETAKRYVDEQINALEAIKVIAKASVYSIK